MTVSIERVMGQIWSARIRMKVHEAKVCVECDEIVHVGCGACPSCTCEQFLSLSAVLETVLEREEINRLREERATVNA